MAHDRPDVRVRTGFSGASVMFEVKVTNHTQEVLRSVRLTPRPAPLEARLDRSAHLIPMLRPRSSREVVFRLSPRPDQLALALDLVVEWEDASGSRRGRLETSSPPVDLTPPELCEPREGVERWRAKLRGGAAVEVRMRSPREPDDLLDAVEAVAGDLPGATSAMREDGPRGRMGRVWLRCEAPRGARAGLLVDVTPDPREGGSRALVTVTATDHALLVSFNLLCIGALEEALEGISDAHPVSLTEES